MSAVTLANSAAVIDNRAVFTVPALIARAACAVVNSAVPVEPASTFVTISRSSALMVILAPRALPPALVASTVVTVTLAGVTESLFTKLSAAPVIAMLPPSVIARGTASVPVSSVNSIAPPPAPELSAEMVEPVAMLLMYLMSLAELLVSDTVETALPDVLRISMPFSAVTFRLVAVTLRAVP